MDIEVIILGKNHYDMDGNKGANLVLFGSHEETNNKAGIAITEAVIDYDDHFKVNVFPALYKASIEFVGAKSRGGKNVTSLKLSNLEFKNRVKFTPDISK